MTKWTKIMASKWGEKRKQAEPEPWNVFQKFVKIGRLAIGEGKIAAIVDVIDQTELHLTKLKVWVTKVQTYQSKKEA